MTARALALALALLCAVSAPALAATVEGQSRIDAVAVHPDGALVTRLVTVDLPAGASEVAVRDLPGSADADTLRVEGSAGVRLVIHGHEVVQELDRPAPAADEGLKALREEREDEQARLDAAEAVKASVRLYAETPPGPGREGHQADAEAWRRSWDAVGEGLAKAEGDVIRARRRIRDLDARIEAMGGGGSRIQGRGHVAQGLPRGVLVSVEADKETKATLKVTYRVDAARWGALYDVRLSTGAPGEAPSVELVRRAAVTQSTGEDWQDVALTVLSTPLMRPTQGPRVAPVSLAAPAPQPQRPLPPMPMPMARSVQGGPGISLEAADASRIALAESAANAMPSVQFRQGPVEAQMTVAAVETRGTAHVFAVPGKVSVSGTGASRSVRLERARVEASVRSEVAARIDPTPYLVAEFAWKGEVPLFAGDAFLERDGVPVGRGRIPFVASGQRHTAGFGADDLVKVTVGPDAGQSAEPGIFGTNMTRTTDVGVSVRNDHRAPWVVKVSDAVPFSTQEEVKVENVAMQPPPDENGSEGRRGVVAWQRKLQPGASLDVRLAYTVRWPNGRSLITNQVR